MAARWSQRVEPATNKEQGDDYQGNSGYPGMLVGDASQDGIQSQKIPLGHDVRWRGEWVGVDRVVWVAEGDWGSESNQGYTDGPHDSAHKATERTDAYARLLPVREQTRF